jgi:hypothetical protein
VETSAGYPGLWRKTAAPRESATAVKLAHQPRHQARHARPRARRRPRSASAWVGVLVLAGMAMSPEPSAPAAQLRAHPATAPVALGAPAVHPVSLTVDEPHDPWRASAAPAPAAAPFVGTRWGTDIGWPQCGHALPGIAVDFTIVQVTAGRPGTVSPCLREQVAWARSVRSVLNAYVVPGSPSAADLAAADRDRSCRGDRSCRLRAAGAADAAHALAGAEAAGLEARGWWLDVEDVAARTLWGTDTEANTQVLIGWRDELRRAGKQVGVYSTRGYWRQIVGHWRADLPQWPAVGLAGVGAAERACDRPFTSGPVLVTQWLTGPLDGNVLCPDRDALAAAFFGHFARARTAGVPSLLITPVPHPDIEAALRAQAELEARQAAEDKKAEEAAKAKAKAKAKAEAKAKAKAEAKKRQQVAATTTTHPPAGATPNKATPEAEPTATTAPRSPPAEPAPTSAPEPAPASTPPEPAPSAGTG